MSPPHRGADRNSQPDHSTSSRKVAPSQGRGSKQPGPGHSHGPRSSPPHRGADRNIEKETAGRSKIGRPLTGARIETHDGFRAVPHPSQSPPHRGADRNTASAASSAALIVAPSQGRGSKLRARAVLKPRSSRPLTGARIETALNSLNARLSCVAPHRGADRNRKMSAVGRSK